MSQSIISKSPVSQRRLSVFIVAFMLIGGYILLHSSAATTVTGASLAVCTGTGGACSPGSVPSASVNLICGSTSSNGCGSATATTTNLMVDNGTGTIENRSYGYYIPSSLKHDGAADGMPAAVFDFSRNGCGTAAASGQYYDSQLGPVADANHFMIIFLECLSGTSNPLHPETDCGTTCSASKSPSDEPYIKAAVADATTRFHIDPVRRYLIGGSSAANMTRDAICSTSTTPHNSTLFRGIMTMGGGAQALLNSTSGVCPSGDKNVFWLEIMGKANQSDPYTTINIPTTNPTHTVLGFTDTRDWWASYLGNCGTPTHTTTGSGVLSDIYAYNTCNNTVSAASPFFEAVAVTNGGHMWCGLDASNSSSQACISTGACPCTNNTGGWSTANFMWNFFANTATTTGGGNPPTPGDITGDGHVDSTDLGFMIANYNTVYPAADFNNSGKVDGSDFATLLKYYGT